MLTFFATAIIVFIIGFAIGRYVRFSNGKLYCITTTDQPHQGPVYNYIQSTTAKSQENLELEVNVAYHHPSNLNPSLLHEHQ
jgi:prolipoprotein diacylglyceryltransferase